MPDLVLDTNVFGDFLAQYFNVAGANRGEGEFTEDRLLSRDASRCLNQIVNSYKRRGNLSGGIIVVPALALIEVSRKWDDIIAGRLSVDQFASFIQQPAPWISIATWDETLLPAFFLVPTQASCQGELRNVEWTDAVFAATALARYQGESIVNVATTDSAGIVFL